jgi:hypothetical protein
MLWALRPSELICDLTMADNADRQLSLIARGTMPEPRPNSTSSSSAGWPLSTESSSAASRLTCRYRSRSYSSVAHASPPCASADSLIPIRRTASAVAREESESSRLRGLAIRVGFAVFPFPVPFRLGTRIRLLSPSGILGISAGHDLSVDRSGRGLQADD